MRERENCTQERRPNSQPERGKGGGGGGGGGEGERIVPRNED